VYASKTRKEKFSGHDENCPQNATDLEDSLVTSSRPPGRLQKRPGDRSSHRTAVSRRKELTAASGPQDMSRNFTLNNTRQLAASCGADASFLSRYLRVFGSDTHTVTGAENIMLRPPVFRTKSLRRRCCKPTAHCNISRDPSAYRRSSSSASNISSTQRYIIWQPNSTNMKLVHRLTVSSNSATDVNCGWEAGAHSPIYYLPIPQKNY